MNIHIIGKAVVTLASVLSSQAVASESQASMLHVDSDGSCVVYDYPVNPDGKPIQGSNDYSSSVAGSQTATATIYRWQDEQGVSHYGEAVPPAIVGEAIEGGRRGTIDKDALRGRPYDGYVPPEPEEKSGADWRARLFEAKARTTRLFLEGLEKRLANLEAAEFVPECEEALRARIQETRTTIEQHQENLRRFEAEAKRRDYGND